MQSDTLEIVPVQTKADMEAFIQLPYRLHKDDPNWIAPLLMERRDALNPKKNPYLRRANVRFWLAKRGTQTVGRISAQIDPLVAKMRDAEEGHFGMIAAEDDADIFAALTKTAEDWLYAQGVRTIFGPFNLSINEETGLLVDGHDTPPMMLMGHDFPYVADRLDEQGYDKVRDLFAYVWRAGEPLPPMLQAFQKKPPGPGMVVRTIKMNEYKQEMRRLIEIFDDAWSENWGFVPFSEEEIEHMSQQLRPLIIKDLVWFVEIDGEPAAFIVGLPNINDMIGDLKGKLLPFGWAKLLWRLKVAGPKSVRIPLLGVRKKYQKSLLGPRIVGRLMCNVHRVLNERGIQKLEVSWILEDNAAMRRLATQMGNKYYKTYRVFQKTLS